MVERFYGKMESSPDDSGPWVRFSDYADLQRQLAEMRAERDRWEKHATTGDDVLGRTRDKLCAAEAERDRLAAENERLREALEPFAYIANICDHFSDVIDFSNDDRINVVQAHGCFIETMSIKDFTDARAALDTANGAKK